MTATVDDAWHLLSDAVQNRSAFNFLQLATIGRDGSPQLRTIVVRGCDPSKAAITFVTDIRSAKVQKIGRDARVSLVGVDAEHALQLRLYGQAAVNADAQARKRAWARLRTGTLVLFDAPFPPGTPVDSSGVALVKVPDEYIQSEPFERFAVVTVIVERFEWLDLAAVPHVRWLFTRHGSTWQTTALTP
jgi:hypothetical protein